MGKKLTFQKGRLATALSSNRNVEWLCGGSVVIVMIVVILVIVPVLSIVVVGMVRRRRPVGGGRASHGDEEEKARTGGNVEEPDTDEKEQSEKRGFARARMERSLDLLSVRWLPRHSLCPRETIPEACGGKRRRERNAGLVGRRTGPLLSKF